MDIITPGPVIGTFSYGEISGEFIFEFAPNFSSKWNEKFDRAQKFVDAEVLRLCDPKVPKRNGALILSGTSNTNIGSGTVEYATPYARRWYYQSTTKSGKPINFKGAPQRGTKWFERMKKESGKDILKGTQKILNGK